MREKHTEFMVNTAHCAPALPQAASAVVFLLYPSVSQIIFQGLACVQLDANEYWLNADR